MLSKEDLMKNKEDLLRNIDELYESCLDELYGNYLRAESERVRQKNMNAALREKITEQGKKLEEANAEITQRDETITALQNEITRLTQHNESDALRAEITERDKTITALQNEITRLTEHNESDALKTEITERDKTITALQEEITRITQHNESDALRAEITQRDNTITALQNEITRLTEHDESDALRAEITQRDKTITALQDTITRITQHNESDALKAEITERDKTITALQREITRLTEHNESDTLRAEITALNAEIAKKQRLIDAMKAKFSELSEKAVAKIRTLKARILQDAQSIAALRAENETLRQTPPQAPALLTQPSEWPREFLFLRSPKTGGVVPTFWNTFINNFPLGPLAGQARRYDLYIGYLCEYRGFNVEYCGINNGVYDDGIDLICRKDNWALLVRCKAKGMKSYFVYYLAARALRFKMDNPSLNVGALCVTSATLSNNAKNVADKFSIAVKDTIPFQNFPYVKCKVLDDGTRVHYTPLDNEYLTTTVITENGDMFCDNVNDAMQQGF